MKTLDEIAIDCKADKASNIHNYCWLYEECFGHLREKGCTILEIGVNSGASMLMWEQAFPLAKVIGIDHFPHKLRFQPKRVIFEWGDVLKHGFFKSVLQKHGPFDIVLDDAAHKVPCSKAIMECFPDHLKPGGWLVLEDINIKVDSGFGDFAKSWIDRLRHEREVLPQPHPTYPKPYPRKWFDSMPYLDRMIKKIVCTHGTMAIQRT